MLVLLDSTVNNCISFQHALFDMFTVVGYVAIKIFLNDKTSDGHAVGGAESGILDIYTYGNLRVMVWSESEKYGVVASVGILCRTCFPTNFDVLEIGQTASASCYCHTHSFSHRFEMSYGYGGDMFCGIFGF